MNQVRLSLSNAGGALGLLFAVLAGGCQQEEISHYHAPKGEPAARADAGESNPTRLLAAIIKHGERTWFFKLTGLKVVVDAHKAEFDQFVHSLRFNDQRERPVSWDVPAGWTQEPGAGLRYGSFRIGAKKDAVELTVIPLSGAAGSIAANVNRWRSQLGLQPLPETELGQVITEATINDNRVTLVDMTGTGSGKTNMSGAPFAGRQPPREPAGRPQIRFTTPSGWEQVPDPKGIAVVTFRIRDGSRTADVSATGFPGAAGGVIDNINRWRAQLGLGPATEEQIKNDLLRSEVGGIPGLGIDLLGPEGAERQRISGVITLHNGSTWFFKMKGPAELVTQQQPAFEAFLRSVQFEGVRTDG